MEKSDDKLRVILVDDEKFIREALKQMIPWDELDLRVIAVCKNGVEAYNYILDESPDIVLTDIKMPGIDGIELIDQIKKTDSSIEFILLSGYGEFEFAQKAMSYGIRHYLLKPCNDEDIVTALKEVSGRIREGRKLREDNNSAECEISVEKHHKIIESMLEYIDSHLNSPELTLKWFSENLAYMNADYLSRLFLSEVGKKFSDYVNEKRVNRAMEMIRRDARTDLNEITEEVGFSTNPLYFSKVFKKYAGTTLTKYRQSIGTKPAES